MADATGAADGPADGATYESDFSFRKMKLAAIVLMAHMFGSNLIAFTALALINVQITGEFGWTQTQYALTSTAMLWAVSVSLPLWGFIMDRIGVRLPLMIGTLGVACTLLALSRITALWQFYLCFFLLGSFGCTQMGYTKVIGALFTQHRGKAMALLGVESTLAGAMIPQIANWLISDHGWRTLFMVDGLVVVVLAVVVYFNLDEPGEINSDRNLLRFRKASKAAAPKPILPGLEAKQVFTSRVYWFILLATMIGSGPRTGMTPSLVPMLLEKGFRASDAAWYLSTITLLAPIGSLVAGFALDKVQDARIAIPFKACTFAGLLCFALASSQFGGWNLLIMAILFSGFSYGTAVPIGSYLHIRFFGLKAFAFYYGFETAFLAFMIGGAAPIVTVLRESSGSYASAYLVMLVCLAFGTILYALLGPYRFAANIGAVPIAAPPPAEPSAAPPAPGAIAAR
jgi:MFS family permease